MLLVVAVVYFATPSEEQAVRTAVAEEQPQNLSPRNSDVTIAAMMQVDVQNKLKARMKDPGSVQFRNVRVFSGGGAKTVCGEVNAKNGFGGYNGFQRFLGAGALIVMPSDMAAGEFHQTWETMCR